MVPRMTDAILARLRARRRGAPILAFSVLAALGLVGAQVAPAATSAVPSRAAAARYAHRTYVVDAQLGRRRFALTGPRAVVTAADGSRITAFGMLLADSGDGTGQAVLLFRGRRFLGWASAYMAVRLVVGRSGSAIAVTYGVYRGNDPFCCPSSRKVVRYSWTGGRIVASGRPPLIYGQRGERLHLAPA